MITATLFPGKYIQGYGAMDGLHEWIRRYGKKAFIIGSPSVFDKIMPGILAMMQETDSGVFREICRRMF